MTLRTLARTCLALFAASSAFPVVADGSNQQRPLGWLGVVDVVLAVALVGAVARLATRAHRAVTDPHRVVAFRATRGLLGLIPLLLAMYFVAGARVNWTVLVIGLAWRGWLLVSSLPYLIATLASAVPAARGAGPARATAPPVV